MDSDPRPAFAKRKAIKPRSRRTRARRHAVRSYVHPENLRRSGLLEDPGKKNSGLASKRLIVGVTLWVTQADPLNMTVRELLHLLLHSRSPLESDWINIRTDQLPWRQLVNAAERGEVELSRVGRKLMMRRSELDRWLSSQRIGPGATVTTTVAEAKPSADVTHLVAKLGFASGAK